MNGSGAGGSDPPNHTLALTVSGGGAVSGGPIANCRNACDVHVPEGTSVILNAVADAGSDFIGWSGACTGTSVCTVRVNSDLRLAAAFAARPAPPGNHNLVVSIAGAGTVRSIPPGIDCASLCVAVFDDGTSIALDAVAATGSRFAGWSGACLGRAACVLKLSADATVAATFETPPPPPPGGHTLSVTVDGEGTVGSTPGGIDCGFSCSAGFEAGTKVTLSRAAAGGWRFAGWSGACSGAGACTIRMDGDAAVKATFVRVAKLTLSFSGNGHGSVTAGATTCTETCDAVFDAGSKVKVSAKAPADARFMGWTGPCQGLADCVVKLDKDVTVGAIFWPFPAYTVVSFADSTARPGGMDAQGNVVFVMSPNSVGEVAFYREAQTGVLRQLWPTNDAWATSISPNGAHIALTTFRWNGADDAWKTYRQENGVWKPVGDLGGADGSFLGSIGDDGVIIGGSHVSGTGDQRIFHGMMDDGHRVYDFGTTERSSYTGGRGGNRIFGSVWDSPYLAHRAAVWETDGIHLLGNFGGDYSFANAINRDGMIVGAAQASDNAMWGFVWDPQSRSLRNIGALRDGGGSQLFAINDGGMAVGDAGGGTHGASNAGVLWFNGTLWDLNDLVEESITSLSTGLHINANGQIVGTGMVRGHWGLYLLIPR